MSRCHFGLCGPVEQIGPAVTHVLIAWLSQGAALFWIEFFQWNCDPPIRCGAVTVDEQVEKCNFVGCAQSNAIDDRYRLVRLVCLLVNVFDNKRRISVRGSSHPNRVYGFFGFFYFRNFFRIFFGCTKILNPQKNSWKYWIFFIFSNSFGFFRFFLIFLYFFVFFRIFWVYGF